MQAKKFGKLVLYNLEGDLSVKTLLDIKDKVNEARQQKLSVALDMRGVESLNSNAVGFFSNVQKKLQLAGGQFYLVCPNEDVFEVISLVGLDDQITIYQDWEEFEAEVIPKYQE